MRSTHPQGVMNNYNTHSMASFKYTVIYRAPFTKVVFSLLIHTECQFEWCNASGYQQWELHIYAKPFKCESQTQLRFLFLPKPTGCLAGSMLNFHILSLIPNRAIRIVNMYYAMDVSVYNLEPLFKANVGRNRGDTEAGNSLLCLCF